MKASGKVVYKKIDGDRHALKIEVNGENKWYSLHLWHSNVENKEELARKIKEDIKNGSVVDVEYVVSDKGFFNITDIEVVVDYNEGVGEEPEEDELFKEKPAKTTETKKSSFIKFTPLEDPTKVSIQEMSAKKTAFDFFGKLGAAGISSQLFSTMDDAVEFCTKHAHALAITIAKELAKK